MNFIIYKFARLFFIISLFSVFSQAVVLDPIVKTVDSVKKKRMIFTVRNGTKASIPVELKILEVIGVKNHREIRVETDDIILSHEQLILGPSPTAEDLNSPDAKIREKAKKALTKSRKIIRAEYIGDEIPKIQKLYRILAYEPDIPGLTSTDVVGNVSAANIKIKFQSEGFIFLQQPDVKEKLYLDDTKFKNGIASFVLKNSGTASMYLKVIEDRKTGKTISGIKVFLKNGKTYIVPKSAFATFGVHSFKRVLPNKQIEYKFSYPKNQLIEKIEIAPSKK